MPRWRSWFVLGLSPALAGGPLIGCGGGSGGGPTGPVEGTLEVLASTSGSDPDLDGYTLSVDDGAPRPLPSNGADTVASLSTGTHTVTLAGVAPNCSIGGGNPRNVEIAAAAMTSLRFDIACNPSSAIFVSVATTGEEFDLDGYRVAVDDGNPQPLAINGSVRMGGLTSGEHDVALSDVADNCAVSGTNPVRVTVLGGFTATADFSVSCSPLPLTAPGRDIAFVRDGEVYLLSADGATFTNLTNDPSSDDGPTWSPDGQMIAFVSNRVFSANREWSHIFVMNADGTGPTQLTSGEWHAGWPAWSPDGGKIAFARSGGPNIYVMNSDGSAITQLTSGLHPSWSPDGTRIAFSNVFDVFVMNADGSEVTQVTTAMSTGVHPTWSPDGTKIAFASDQDGTRHIYVMNPDGTGVTQLTFGIQPNDYPAWSPDNSKIAFASERTGTARLYMMNPDGTEQVPITPGSNGTAYPAWRP